MKLKLILGIIICVSASTYFSSCEKMSEEDILGGYDYCADSLVSYENNIQPILNQDCVSCHSGPGAENGVELDSYANLINTVDSTTIKQVINHVSGVQPMPDGKPKLNDCKIHTIEQWIAEGMLDN